MSVDWIREIWDGRDADFDATAGSTRRWRAKTNNKFDDAFTVEAYGRSEGILPARFDSHPSRPELTRRRMTITNDSSGATFWLIEAEYSDEPVSQQEQEEAQAQQITPTDRRARIRWSTTQYSKPVSKDLNGHAICNSAGDFPDPPPEIDASYWVATVTKNVSTIPAWILTVDHPINSESFQIQGLTVEAGKARLSAIEISELQSENGYEFYTFGFSIEFRAEGWQLDLLDQGLHFLDSSDGDKKKPIKLPTAAEAPGDDVERERASSPVMLAGDGEILENPGPETAVYLNFDVYKELDFNLLPLT